MHTNESFLTDLQNFITSHPYLAEQGTEAHIKNVNDEIIIDIDTPNGDVEAINIKISLQS